MGPSVTDTHTQNSSQASVLRQDFVSQKLDSRGSLSSSPYLTNGASDILINGVGDLRSLHAGFEFHGEHARVVPEPPVVCLVTSQTSAVDPGLLAGSNTYDLRRIDAKHNQALLHRDHSQSCIPSHAIRKERPPTN